MQSPSPTKPIHLVTPTPDQEIAVVTASCGSRWLQACVQSVGQQTHPNLKHYIVVDGPRHAKKVKALVREMAAKPTVVVLPHPTGENQYNGHRIYAAFSFLSNSPLIAFLDEDNIIEPRHYSELLKVMERHQLDWAYSLRKILDPAGREICCDDCDSLGIWGSWYGNQHHIDTSCYLLRRQVAAEAAWIWNRPAYSEHCLDPDKALCRWLLDHKQRGFTSGRYSLRYRLGSTTNSAHPEYFREGNTVMRSMYKYFPWRQPILQEIDERRDYRRIVARYEPQRTLILKKLRARSTRERFAAPQRYSPEI